MKRALFILALCSIPAFILTSCSTPTSTPGFASAPDRAYPSAAASAGADGNLDNLKLGVLPDTSLSPEEQKLAGLLTRKVKAEFPLKIGVLLYKETTSLEENIRKELFNGFLQKLRQNPDVSLIMEISPSLVTRGSNIEDLRKLAARFQVSTLLIINDSYQNLRENKELIITPADIITGNRNWESNTNIEIFALDILNGVFVYSTSANGKMVEKFNKQNPNRTKEEQLIKESAINAWKEIEDKATKQIAEFKKQSSTTSNP